MVNFAVKFTKHDRFPVNFSEQDGFTVGLGNVTFKVSTEANTYIIEDEYGNEVVGVLVDELTAFDATPNDIRLGKVAATDVGVVVGEKVIPTYNTLVGVKVVTNGSKFSIPNVNPTIDFYDYTKLQTMICKYNKNLAGSVSTEKVSIEDSVYNVQSVEPISTIIKNHETKSIDFGITNDYGVPCVIRYFTYKEIL
jgi:hypothetical protein